MKQTIETVQFVLYSKIQPEKINQAYLLLNSLNK